jgi:nicotinamidase-related amidase
MKKLLAVIDMQEDFLTGTLGNKECEAVIPAVVEKCKSWDGDIAFTRDTHGEDYLDTQEGKLLPVEHCIEDTKGWMINEDVLKASKAGVIFNKDTFGSLDLVDYIKDRGYLDVTLVGVCTDICVISNAMLIKAIDPEMKVTVDSKCCAGVTPESHQRALDAMKACQINIE